ncbi:MAG: hypothetical protein IJ899_01040 [Blautia sp.]|nr:hypothetical protein [Blautia sp.]
MKKIFTLVYCGFFLFLSASGASAGIMDELSNDQISYIRNVCDIPGGMKITDIVSGTVYDNFMGVSNAVELQVFSNGRMIGSVIMDKNLQESISVSRSYSNYRLKDVDGYQDGYTLVIFEENYVEYEGVADENGNILFCRIYHDDGLGPDLNAVCSGYTFLYEDGYYYTFTVDGKQTGTYQADKVVFINGKYIWVREEEYDFDHASAEYYLYNGEGDLETSFHIDGTYRPDIRLIGTDTFYYRGYDPHEFYYQSSLCTCYSGISHKWLGDYRINFDIDDGLFKSGFVYLNSLDHGFRIINLKGEIQNVTFPDVVNSDEAIFVGNNDTYCYFWVSINDSDDSGHRTYLAYNMEERYFIEFDNEKYLNYITKNKDLTLIQNGKIALPIEGIDDNNYVCVVNEDFSELYIETESEGNKAFHPVRMEDRVRVISLEDDFFCTETTNGHKYEYTFIDYSGNEFYTDYGYNYSSSILSRDTSLIKISRNDIRKMSFLPLDCSLIETE